MSSWPPPPKRPPLPDLPVVLGNGPLAYEMRRMIAEDPDRYRPETWSMKAVGRCPCCNEEVFLASTRETNFERLFLSGKSRKRHPSFDKDGNPTPVDTKIQGEIAGCCCVAPDWGPRHKGQGESRKAPRQRRKKRT